MEETPAGKVFLTVHVPPPRLVITGAVHISQALAPIAQLLGYDVTIVDPRTAFASIERFPDVKVIAEWPDVALPPLGIDRYTAFVALTHDPKIDDPALTHALARDCFYIGALGSKKTHGRRLERLKAQGIPDAALARIHAPIGLDIGAVSPAEIAVAIMGEITARLRQSSGAGGMKFGAVPVAEAEGARRGAFDPQGRPRAQEGHVDRQGRDRRAQGRRHRRDRGGADRARRRLGGRRRRPRSRRRWQARACASTAPSPAAPICSRRAPACWWSTRTRSIASTRSTSRSPSRRSPAYKPVVAGEMIATVKIIPFAVAAKARDAALAVARSGAPLIRVAPYRIRKIGIVSTLLPGLAPKVIEKTLKVTEERLAPAGASIVAERRVPHEQGALAKAIEEVLGEGAELVIVFGASAIADRRDVIPAAVEADRRAHRAFRHAGRSRQSAAGRRRARPSGARRAGLRALAEGERLRLGSHAAARRP